MKVYRIVVALFLWMPAAVSAQEPLHLEDAAYLLQATSAAKSHLELGRLAAQKATDPEVRAFAAEVVAEYGEREARYAALATPYGVPAMDTLDPVSAWRLGRLQSLEGAAFDATYVAGEEPTLNAEEWFNRRTGRHATRPAIRQEAQALAERTNALWKTALELTIAHEDELPEGPHPDDASVILFAMNIDIAQLALGALATEKAQSPVVKTFAQRMVTEHGQSLDALRTLAEERGLTPLAAPGPLEVFVLEQLKTLDGAAFDIAYQEGQVLFHDNWYKRVEYTAHNGKDEAVKAYAKAAFRLGMDHHDAIYAIVRRGSHSD